MTGAPAGSVAIIIPTLNGANTLGEQLDAIAAQRRPADDIVVADNGSTDRTAELVAEHARRGLPVRLIDASGVPGSAFARNQGVAATESELLAFCDADDVVDPGWLSALVERLGEFDLVGGRLDGERLNTEAVASWRSPRSTAALSTPEGFLPFAPSGNLAVRRDVWTALGGMRVDYPKAHDVEFSWRAQLRGFTLGFAADALVHYRYRSSGRATFRQGMRSGRASAQLYRDFRDRGLRGRSLSTTVRDWAWLVARAPRAVSAEERGVWLRRAGQAVGRLSGSARFRVRYL